MLSLEQVQERVEHLAGQIGAPAGALPTFGRTADGGRPHLECDGAYHFVVVERGREFERRTTTELDQLLYWVFEAVTFEVAMAAARQHRAPGQGFRRRLFRRQIELMAGLDPSWGQRCKASLAAILAKNPFTDWGPRGID